MSWPDELLNLFPRLNRLPPDCYVVGGAIRDILLKRRPTDVDVACIHPRACAELLGARVIRLGSEEHLSAWRVVDAEHVYDVADLLDHDLRADLARRDFTVNAMAVSLGSGEFFDHYGGVEDLRRRVVRMIDPANFDDDPLRCLKAVRMAVILDFDIDDQTMDAIRARARKITAIAPERVTYEIAVIFSSGRFRKALRLLRQSSLDEPLFGYEVDAGRYRADDVTHSGALALVVRDPRTYGRKWRWSEALIREVMALQNLMTMNGDRRVALYDSGQAIARQLPAVLRAIGDDAGVVMPDFSIRALLSGDQMGMDEGPELGRVKRALLEAQIRGEVRTPEEALAFVQRLRE